MNKWYAEIDETGFCFHTTQTELPLSDTILLADADVIGKKYENGKWVEVEQEATPEPSQLDRIEETVNAIASGTTAENTEAINALLGG